VPSLAARTKSEDTIMPTEKNSDALAKLALFKPDADQEIKKLNKPGILRYTNTISRPLDGLPALCSSPLYWSVELPPKWPSFCSRSGPA